MDAVAQEDDRRVARRVDPDRGAGEAGVAEAFALGKEFAAVAGEAGVHVPAVGAQAAWNRTRRGHGADGQWTEDAATVVRAATQNHLGVDREIVRSGKQSSMPGHAAQQIGTRVMDFADHPVPVVLLCRRGTLGKFTARPKAGFGHAQRLEDMPAGKLIERHAGNVLDQLAEDDVVHVAIREARP